MSDRWKRRFAYRAVMIVALPLLVPLEAAEYEKSWLGCIQDMSIPVLNDLSLASMEGERRKDVVFEFQIDKNARPVLSPGTRLPRKISLPMILATQFIDGQIYKRVCVGRRFRLTVTFVLADHDSGRQTSRIMGNDTVELVFHEGERQ